MNLPEVSNESGFETITWTREFSGNAVQGAMEGSKNDESAYSRGEISGRGASGVNRCRQTIENAERNRSEVRKIVDEDGFRRSEQKIRSMCSAWLTFDSDSSRWSNDSSQTVRASESAASSFKLVDHGMVGHPNWSFRIWLFKFTLDRDSLY